MRERRRALAGTAVAVALLLLGTSAEAEPRPLADPVGAAPSAPPAPAPAPAPGDAATAEALAHFLKGNALFEKEAWAVALAEFLESLKLHPTKNATRNAAVCLRQLGRFDEALDLYAALPAQFADLPADLEAEVRRAVGELEGLVGTLVLDGAERGAVLVIDGRFRGSLPLAAPLRASAGHHEIRAYKEGFDPFEATVEITGKRESVAHLRSQSTDGRLKVIEQHGKVLDVLIDGTLVGKTPWEGSVAVGEHLVLLGGDGSDAPPGCTPQSEGALAAKRAGAGSGVALGTQPVRVPVRAHEMTPLTLTAEDLDTFLRVEPTPAGATVAIDAVVLGRGTWEGHLRAGAHTLEIAAEGFLPEKRSVRLAAGQRQTVAVTLENGPSSPFAPRPGSLLPALSAYGVGAVGLGVFAVTGALALHAVTDLRSRCQGDLCPEAERANVASAGNLARASNVGLVVAGAGVVAGTILFFVRPGGRSPPKAGERAFGASVGLGRIAFEGRF